MLTLMHKTHHQQLFDQPITSVRHTKHTSCAYQQLQQLLQRSSTVCFSVTRTDLLPCLRTMAMAHEWVGHQGT